MDELIQTVAPLYTTLQTKHGTIRQLLGVELRVLAQPEVSAEWLERALKCHAAKQLLGQLPAVPNSPYVLPDNWVEIDVSSDGDGFRISLRGEDSEDARRILARARAYANR